MSKTRNKNDIYDIKIIEYSKSKINLGLYAIRRIKITYVFLISVGFDVEPSTTSNGII